MLIRSVSPLVRCNTDSVLCRRGGAGGLRRCGNLSRFMYSRTQAHLNTLPYHLQKKKVTNAAKQKETDKADKKIYNANNHR